MNTSKTQHPGQVNLTIHIGFDAGAWNAEVELGAGWKMIARRKTSKGIESAVRSWLKGYTRDDEALVATIHWFSTPTHLTPPPA